MCEMKIWSDSHDNTIIMSWDTDVFKIIGSDILILKLSKIIGPSDWEKIKNTDEGENSILEVEANDVRFPQLSEIFYLPSNVTFRTFGWNMFSPKPEIDYEPELKRVTGLYHSLFL